MRKKSAESFANLTWASFSLSREGELQLVIYNSFIQVHLEAPPEGE